MLIIRFQERGYRTPYKFHKHRDVLSQVTRGPVKPRETKEWADIPLQVPRKQIFNVTASNIFGIRHILEVFLLWLNNILKVYFWSEVIFSKYNKYSQVMSFVAKLNSRGISFVPKSFSQGMSFFGLLILSRYVFNG